jgi:hypothetical protein
MADARFTISLRLRHPSMDPRDMSAAIGAEPHRQWKAGDRRVHPSGTLLEGHRDATYWCLGFPDEKESSLADALERHVARLRNCKQFLDDFHASGGSAEFFIGWFVERNSGDVLEWSLLRELADLHISLSFDVYGSEIGNTPHR